MQEVVLRTAAILFALLIHSLDIFLDLKSSILEIHLERSLRLLRGVSFRNNSLCGRLQVFIFIFLVRSYVF